MKNNIKYDMPIFKIVGRYRPEQEELNKTVVKLRQALSNVLGENVTELKRLSIGQNVNFKVYTDGKDEPKYLLRVITMSGYPSIDTLDECYRLLETTGIIYSKKKYFEKSSDIVPYGYLVQEWIEGDDSLKVYGEDEVDRSTKWLEDFVKVLKKVHTVKLPYFGYLGSGPKYKSLSEYYYNMDKIIDNSFGDVFIKPCSIWDLDKHGISSTGFLKRIFDCVRELADNIKSPVQSVLIHGDVLPPNLIYIKGGVTAIDWDEARANWWVYELARTSFYMDSEDITDEFIRLYSDKSASIDEIHIGIKLEHVRQLLRRMCISCFNNTDMDDMRKKVRKFEEAAKEKLEKG